MNARYFSKLASLLCLLPLPLLSQTTSPAQATNAGNDLQFDVQIENGQLLTAPLNGHSDIKVLWGPGDLHSVPATVENLAKYLRAEDSNLNIVLSPGASDAKIGDLKIRTPDMKAVVEAVGIATDGAIRGSTLSGNGNWTFMVRPRPIQEPAVEVFNLTGYFRTLNTTNEDIMIRNLDELEDVVRQTLANLTIRQKGSFKSSENPEFKFHMGTRLLIVMGNPSAIDVTRKIVNALPGQARQGAQELLDISTNRNQN